MLIRWQTSRYWPTTIDRIECERETETSVWINGRRSQKQTEYHSMFNTWEDAKLHLETLARQEIESLESRIADKRRTLEQIITLTKPKGDPS